MSDLMPIKDVAGLSEPITKLIETIGNAIGTIYEPTRIRQKAMADADAAIIQAEANAEVQKIEFVASERIKFLELRRQKNIDKIIAYAQSQLPETVSNQKVDEDWTIQFFNICQDIGNEEMQIIWAKLLAGEIAKPTAFSLQTINTLKLLSPKDAILFKQLCNYTWINQYIVNYYSLHSFFGVRGLDWASVLSLETLGLINLDVGWTIKPEESITVDYFGEYYKFTNHKSYQYRFKNLALTRAGIEIRSLCDLESDPYYISALIDDFSKPESQLEFRKL